MSVQKTTASGAAASVDNPTGGATANTLVGGAEATGIELFSSIRASSSRTKTAPPETAGAAAIPAEAGQAANPQNAQPSHRDQARSWLCNECEKLSKNLEEIGDNPGSLEQIYAVAREFKQTVIDNQEQLQHLWPADLQADFQANLQLIEQYFQGDEATKISLTDIDFLRAYLGFMKTCLGENSETLQNQFNTLDKLLTDIRSRVAAKAEVNNNEPNNPRHQFAPAQAAANNRQVDIQPAQPRRGEEPQPGAQNAQPDEPGPAEPAPTIQTNIRALQNCQHTIQAQRLGIQSVECREGGAAIFENSVKLLAKESQDICKLATCSNKRHKKWMDASNLMLNRLSQLEAGKSLPAITELPNELTGPSPANPSVNKRVGQNTVFQIAKEIAKLAFEPKELRPDNATEDAELAKILGAATNEEKKLAHMVLSAWAAQQAAKDGNNFSNTSERTNQLMTAAGDLLQASINARLAQPGAQATAEPIGRASNELAVETISTIKDGIPKPSELLKNAYAEKTFANDVLVKEVDIKKRNSIYSRQGVFQESMLRAVELLQAPVSPNQSRLTTDKRMSAITLMSLDLPPAIAAKLGFPQAEGDNQVSDALLDQLVMAAVAHNDLSSDPNHVHRGSMLAKIYRYDKHSLLESVIKNHNLDGYLVLSKHLIQTASNIRPEVANQIQVTQTALEDPTKSVRADQINRLVKQIIITTDSKSALNENFNLANLIETSENLIKEDTQANRKAFSASLEGVKKAWVASLPEANGTEAPKAAATAEELQARALEYPTAHQWDTKDHRNALGRAIRSNPVKNLSYVNRIPWVAPFVAGVANIAKGLLLGGGLFAMGTAKGLLTVAGKPALEGIKLTSRYLPTLFR